MSFGDLFEFNRTCFNGKSCITLWPMLALLIRSTIATPEEEIKPNENMNRQTIHQGSSYQPTDISNRLKKMVLSNNSQDQKHVGFQDVKTAALGDGIGMSIEVKSLKNMEGHGYCSHCVHRHKRAATSGPRPSIFKSDPVEKEPVRLSLMPMSETDAGTKLGGFLIDVLTVTDHVDIHLVTKGLIVQGLDTVANMLVSRYIQIEIWSDLYLFLTHLGPTEGYLSADQFIVYGSSDDVINIITQRRAYMDVINTGITTWYYVVLDNDATNQEIADTLEEASISILLRPSLYRVEDWIAYTLVSPGDGTRNFQVIGKWTKTLGLQVTKEVFPKESENFNGRNLIIGVINKPRVLEIISSEKKNRVSMRGYSNDILDIVRNSLNFTVQPQEYRSWGHPDKEGRWNGVIGDLIRKEIHFSPMDFTPTKESREVIDFTDWVSEDPVVITSAAPQPEIRPFLLLEIYNFWFYIIITAILFSCGVVLWIFIQLNMILLPGVYPFPRKHKFREIVPNSPKTIVSQCLRDIPKEFSSRLILISIWFMSFILDAAYQGHITAFIAMPRFTPAIDNYVQLSDNSSVIPVTEKFSTTHHMIVESERESFQKLAERLETYEASFLDSAEFYHGVAVGKWSFLDSHSSTYGRALNFENKRSRCKFHVSREAVLGGLDAWPFPRNSPVHSQISSKIKWLRYFGILEYIKSNYYVSTCQSSLGLKAVDGPSKMDLKMLQGVFYLVGIGWAAAAGSFLLEIVIATARKFHQHNDYGIQDLMQ